MGQGQSSNPRRLTVVNDEASGVIKVSVDCVVDVLHYYSFWSIADIRFGRGKAKK